MGRAAFSFAMLAAALLPAPQAASAAEPASKRWSDADLVSSYQELESTGGLEAAVRAPSLPKEPPHPAFMEALAWYAAGTPKQAGVLTMKQVDDRIDREVGAYMRLLKAKVKNGENNDYARTRTWKVIQKLTILKGEMSQPSRTAGYPYAAKSLQAPVADSWETEHTLRSTDEFTEKVCRASYERPVLVKYGNTNCTQCMLFEMIGSVKELAGSPALAGVDVYKLWFGFEPDDGFAGKIRKPVRLDELAKEEGVSSSPTFVVYRNGRRQSCGDAFPDDAGRDAKLESCVRSAPADAPPAGFCARTAPAAAGTIQ
jgi:hypothetical protein